jgi:hypothetical protein
MEKRKAQCVYFEEKPPEIYHSGSLEAKLFAKEIEVRPIPIVNSLGTIFFPEEYECVSKEVKCGTQKLYFEKEMRGLAVDITMPLPQFEVSSRIFVLDMSEFLNTDQERHEEKG